MEISLHTQIPFSRPGSVHNGSLIKANCGWVVPGELQVSSFPWEVPTLCLDSIDSPLQLCWVKGVHMFRCNHLPPPLLAEWLGCFECHRSNKIEQTLNKSWQKRLHGWGWFKAWILHSKCISTLFFFSFWNKSESRNLAVASKVPPMRLTLEKKILLPLLPDLYSQPFDHESDALPTELSWLPDWEVIIAEQTVNAWSLCTAMSPITSINIVNKTWLSWQLSSSLLVKPLTLLMPEYDLSLLTRSGRVASVLMPALLLQKKQKNMLSGQQKQPHSFGHVENYTSGERNKLSWPQIYTENSIMFYSGHADSVICEEQMKKHNTNAVNNITYSHSDAIIFQEDGTNKTWEPNMSHSVTPKFTLTARNRSLWSILYNRTREVTSRENTLVSQSPDWSYLPWWLFVNLLDCYGLISK